ncbi:MULTISPECIES: VOC family protein [unclassified Roseitalea]|uniref:VOC family protein n=1 Tax=unclassified Roseitalea TaxID=2639107 RepID=UPI00273EF45C|nr:MULTISPECIES: VOC family protein [unclassified Roseitalea]
MERRVWTFLMFAGDAEAALDLYGSLFDDMRIVRLDRYGPGEGGNEGLVRRAEWTLGGQNFMAIDSTVDHGFTFTPAASIFVNCTDDEEITQVFEGLSEGGQVLMALDSYPFSRRFAWVADRYGVSWQLNLP